MRRGTGKAKERVAVADPVMQRGAVGKPDVRQPGTWPGRPHIFHEIVRRTVARFRPDDRGFPIAIAEFGADHLVALALLDGGARRQIGAGLSTLGRLVTNIRLESRAPGAPPARSMTRGFHIACAHLPALGLVGPAQCWPSPAAC